MSPTGLVRAAVREEREGGNPKYTRMRYGWSRKGGSLNTTLSVPEKEVRPRRRFGTPKNENIVFVSFFDLLEMAHTMFFSSIRTITAYQPLI